jgi:hypothetical protein
MMYLSMCQVMVMVMNKKYKKITFKRSNPERSFTFSGTPQENVMLIYIRVFVVLIWQCSRKESEKLDITFRQTQLCLPEFRKYYKYSIFSKFIDINWASLVGLFCHTLGLGV